MKIDFHLHTPSSTINGDSINWTNELAAIKKLLLNNIKSFAFTDHNIFNAERYLKAKKIADIKLSIFPGIEINIMKKSGLIAHLLLIFNNELELEKLKRIEDIARRNLRKSGIRIEKVFDIFQDYDFIVIPHVGKGDYFKPCELNFRHEAIETTSYSNLNYKKWLKEKADKSIVSFSDTHIWKDYPQIDLLETNINFDNSFQSLKKELLKNKNFTKEK